MFWETARAVIVTSPAVLVCAPPTNIMRLVHNSLLSIPLSLSTPFCCLMIFNVTMTLSLSVPDFKLQNKIKENKH